MPAFSDRVVRVVYGRWVSPRRPTRKGLEAAPKDPAKAFGNRGSPGSVPAGCIVLVMSTAFPYSDCEGVGDDIIGITTFCQPAPICSSAGRSERYQEAATSENSTDGWALLACPS